MDKTARHHPQQNGLNKAQRKNKAKQQRLQQTADKTQERKVFSGPSGAPKIAAIIPLCDECDGRQVIDFINDGPGTTEKATQGSMIRTYVDSFKTNLGFVASKRDLLESLDICRGADFVVFVVHPQNAVDELSETMLRTIAGQGVSNTYTFALGPTDGDSIETIRSHHFVKLFFPEQPNLYSTASPSDRQNFIRTLCTAIPKGVKWREERNWMYVEHIVWSQETRNDGDVAVADVALTGHVRGRAGFSADRLIQLGDWGTYQIDRVVGVKRRRNSQSKEISFMAKDWEETDILAQPTPEQDTLDQLAPQEVVMNDIEDGTVSIAPTTMTHATGVLLDDHRYVEESLFPNGENVNPMSKSKRMPRGTSKYQAAWYVDDLSDSGSDLSDVEAELEDGQGGQASDTFDPADGMDVDFRPPTEAGPSEYAMTEGVSDDDEVEDADAEENLRLHRKHRKDAEADLLFPDEIELHPNVSAREQLMKYRGLRSLKTSAWSTDEDKPYEPEDWNRLLEVKNYKGAYGKIKAEEIMPNNPIKPGARITIHLRSVPCDRRREKGNSRALFAFALHRHENKHTCVNVNFNLSTSVEAPLKAKEELLMVCGPRMVRISPLFSQGGNTPNDVHKFMRFVHPGQNAVASFIGPLTWGNVPALFFKRPNSASAPEMAEGGESAETHAMDLDMPRKRGTDKDTQTSTPPLMLIGQGTSLPPSTGRVIAKRIVLTGQPFKIHRRVVTIRYMFFNTEDVAYFSALPLWTNRGRSGAIKESLGTHGYFKATFDSQIGMQDAVGVSLYKRVWPRTSTAVTDAEKEALVHETTN